MPGLDYIEYASKVAKHQKLFYSQNFIIEFVVQMVPQLVI